MEELQRLVAVIRILEGVNPGDPTLGNQDQGHIGQTIDNLSHTDEGADTYGAWKEAKGDEVFRSQVVTAARGYVKWLVDHPKPSRAS